MIHYVDEGYIKFNIDWQPGALPNTPLIDELIDCRDVLYQKGFIGYDEHTHIGYGNLSVKIPEGILISGTQTGHLPTLNSAHFTLVDDYHIETNSLHCVGPIKASSESLTHAAIYDCAESIKAVIHIHHHSMWKQALYTFPTSNPNVPYGTPQMALEIYRLFADTNLSKTQLMAMAGHQDGIICFGENLTEAAARLLAYDQERTR